VAIVAPMLLGVIYIILCAVNLRQSVWFDESFGAYLTRFSFEEIWQMTADDVHPPLYYFLLKIWSMLFGYTDYGMRLMSVFFGAIAIVFAWQWTRRKFGTKPALLATGLMTLSPMLIRYGQEMRMYTMTAAIIFASTYVLQLAIDTRQRKYWIVYGVLMAIGMWTHYFVVLVFLTHLAYLVYLYRKKIFQKDIITSYVVATVLYLPWLPAFLGQAGEVQQGFWIGDPELVTVTDYLAMATLYRETAGVVGWLVPLILVIFGCLVFLVRKMDKKSTLLKLVAFLPPVLLLAISMPPLTPMFVDRYVIYSMICLALVVGIAIATIKFRHKVTPYAITALFVGTLIIGIANVYTVGNYNFVTNSRSDAKALFDYVVASSDEGEPIISNSEWLYYDLAFYGTDKHPVFFAEELVTYKWGSHRPLERHSFGKITDLDVFLDEHAVVWFVGSLPKDGDLEFPREGFSVLQKLTLDVNVNQPSYQALQLSRVAGDYSMIEYNLVP